MTSGALVTRTIALTTLTLWKRELARTLSLSERVIGVGSGVIVSVAVALSVTLYWVTSEFFSEFGGGEFFVDPRPLLRLVFAGVLCGTATYQVVLCVTTPNRSALANLLTLLPVKRHWKVLGQFIPIFGIGLLFSIVAGVPSLSIVFQLVGDGAFSLGGTLAFLWIALWVSTTVPAVFFLVRTLARRLVRLPPNYALVTAALVSALWVLGLAGADLIPRQLIEADQWWTSLSPTRALTDVLVGHAATATLSWISLVAWSAIAVVLAVAMTRVRERADEQVSTRVLVGLPVPRRRFGSLLWFEIVSMARLPQFLISVLVILVGTIAIPAAYRSPELQSFADQLAPFLLVVAAAIGMYSFGSTYQSHWILRLATGGRVQWVLPKAIAALSLPAILCAPYLTLLVLAGVPLERVLDMASLALAMVGAALACGVLVPFVATQALSASITSAVTAVVWVLFVFGARFIDGYFELQQPLLATVIAALLLFGVYSSAAFASSKNDRVLRA